MNAAAFLLRHGYALLFAATLLEQLGMPLPAAPVLLASGALCRAGQMHAGVVLLLVVAASLLGHFVWYEAGRRRGAAVLRLVCKLSLEPDTCVRKTQDLFARHGSTTLLLAPWVPGLGGVAPPLAGISRMPLTRFLPLDAVASLLWAATVLGLGYAFGDQIAQALDGAARMGLRALLAAALLLLAYLAFKAWQRQRTLRALQTARILPEELKRRLDAGERIFLVDVRSAVDGPRTLPGALRFAPDQIELHVPLIPTDLEVIVFCS
jgi:membrane protein DedA with SNARE-associated domain